MKINIFQKKNPKLINKKKEKWNDKSSTKGCKNQECKTENTKYIEVQWKTYT
jgi:hypothetical protein